MTEQAEPNVSDLLAENLRLRMAVRTADAEVKAAIAVVRPTVARLGRDTQLAPALSHLLHARVALAAAHAPAEEVEDWSIEQIQEREG